MKKSADFGLFLFGEVKGDESKTPELIPPAATGDVTPPDAGETQQQTRERFRAMMEGEFKHEFTAYFNETFNRRFKEYKGLEEELRSARAVVDAVRARYGDIDIGELPDVIRADMADKASSESTVLPDPETASLREQEMLDVRLQMQKEQEKAVACARLETERAVMETVRARGARPFENALSDSHSGGRGGGIPHLTRAERAAVAERAAKGERISF